MGPEDRPEDAELRVLSSNPQAPSLSSALSREQDAPPDFPELLHVQLFKF